MTQPTDYTELATRYHELEILNQGDLPLVSAGPHHTWSGRACTMELLSLHAKREFSDAPSTAPYYLISAVTKINDLMPDHMRQVLLMLLPALDKVRGPINDPRAPLYQLHAKMAQWFLRNNKTPFDRVEAVQLVDELCAVLENYCHVRDNLLTYSQLEALRKRWSTTIENAERRS